MKTGLSFFFMATGRDETDQQVYADELEIASAAEGLGFDALWATEHHFTGYSMLPNPLHFLAYMAGRSERLELGSMVVVLPWHNPARLAGEIGMIDNLTNGRFRLGLGRGLGRVEFEGLGADMDSSREVFDESAEMILGALESGYIEASGKYVNVPKRELRPRPTGSFIGRTYGAAVSPESVKSMARLGAGLIIIPQKPWERVVGELELYREEFTAHHPDREIPKPVVAVHTYCHRDPQRAKEMGRLYNARYYQTVMDHYGLAGRGFANQKGYSYYAKVADRIDASGRDEAAEYYADLHVYGTPAQCLEKIEWIKDTVGCGTLLNIVSYSGMPAEEARENLRLYADEVRPAVAAMK